MRGAAMFGRVLLALVIGLCLGIIAAGGGFALARPSGVAQAAALGDPSAPYDLALTITEAFFATQVNKPPADTTGETKRTTLQDARIRLRADGTIEVSGKAQSYGFLVPIYAVVQPRVVGGKIEMAIVRGRAGGLAVPASVAEDIATIINRQIANTLAKRDFQVLALQPGPGTLVIHLK